MPRTTRTTKPATKTAAPGGPALVIAAYQAAPERPRTRAECLDGPRPCPYVSCQHHLFLDVQPKTGAIKLNFPDLEPEQLKESCALDVADRGGTTLEEVGAIMNLTRQRIGQIVVRAMAWAARSRALRDHLDEGELRPVRRLPVVTARSAA